MEEELLVYLLVLEGTRCVVTRPHSEGVSTRLKEKYIRCFNWKGMLEEIGFNFGIPTFIYSFTPQRSRNWEQGPLWVHFTKL